MDQLTSVTQGGTTSFAYDVDGQTTSKGSNTITWDGRARTTGGTFAGATVTYSFDAARRRRQRVGGATTTRYLFAGSGEAPLFETNSGGVVQLTAVEGAAGDLAHYAGTPDPSTTVEFVYYTGHGDLAATADINGTRTAAFSYDAFGVPNQTPPSNKAVERWTGRWDKQLDTTSSLIQMGARPYDPTLGRFLAVDPVDGGSLNSYDFAAQDCENNYDLDGQRTISEGGGAYGSGRCNKSLLRLTGAFGYFGTEGPGFLEGLFMKFPQGLGLQLRAFSKGRSNWAMGFAKRAGRAFRYAAAIATTINVFCRFPEKTRRAVSPIFPPWWKILRWVPGWP